MLVIHSYYFSILACRSGLGGWKDPELMFWVLGFLGQLCVVQPAEKCILYQV